MKSIWLIALVVVSPFCCAEADDADLNGFAAETARAFELERKADFVADYSTDGELDIGVGRIDRAQNIHQPISFALDELEGFFDEQRHKDLIVVVVAKNRWSDEELQKHVLKLRDYFVARGYKKVVIEQGLGGGRGIHLEYDAKAKAEQGGAGLPATRSESDLEGTGGVSIAESEEDPFGGVDDNAPDESKPRVVTEDGRKTLEILRTEKLDTVTLDPGEPQNGFEIIKAKLAKRGVTVRLKHYGDPKSKSQPGGPLALRNIPLDKFMPYFDQWACWGWILYPDGSITYFDNQCCGSWPKDGLYCHDSQYEAGKPEVMAKEQKAANEKPREQAAPPDGGKPSK